MEYYSRYCLTSARFSNLTTRSLDSEHASQHTLSQSLSPEIGTVAAGRVYGVKGCMAELTLALICVAAAGQLVVVQ